MMEAANKADMALVDMAVDEPSPDGGGSRRPGNLWTVEAREDMFRRREAGETWETICQDYPKRSRHAMQQQYSMMKKQRALAAGTWTSNRRGRKRKNLSPERWAPGIRNGALDMHDDDLTEADDLSDADLAADEIDTTRNIVPRLPSLVEDPNLNGRPGGPPRSITDPPPRTARPRTSINGTRYNLGSIPDNAPPRQSPSAKVFVESPPIGAAVPSKRRKVSPDRPPEAKVPMSAPPLEPAVSPNFVFPSVVFEHAEFLAFLQKGIDQAQLSAKAFEAEKGAMRQNFEASAARSNRRLHDATERLRWAQYENGEKVKARDGELNEKLKAKARDYAEEKESMRKEFEREKKHVQDIQVKNIEALTRENELLRHDLEAQRRQMELQSQDYEREVSRLKSDQQQTRTTPKFQDLVDRLPPTPDNKHFKQGQHEDSSKPSDNAADESMPSWKVLRQNQIDTFGKLVTDVEILSSSITRLNKEVENSSMKQILKDINHLDEESITTVSSKEKAAQALKSFHAEAENFLGKKSIDDTNHEDTADDAKMNGT